MAGTERILLIAPSHLYKTSAFERAVALAKATSCALHIAAFDYLEGLATALLVEHGVMSAQGLPSGWAAPQRACSTRCVQAFGCCEPQRY